MPAMMTRDNNRITVTLEVTPGLCGGIVTTGHDQETWVPPETWCLPDLDSKWTISGHLGDSDNSCPCPPQDQQRGWPFCPCLPTPGTLLNPHPQAASLCLSFRGLPMIPSFPYLSCPPLLFRAATHPDPSPHNSHILISSVQQTGLPRWY